MCCRSVLAPALPWAEKSTRVRRVDSSTSSAPISSRQASTSRSGDVVSLSPALIRPIMVWMPGLSASPICWLAKLMRSTSVPLSSQSVPWCQPSTLGGLLSICPMYEAWL